MAKKVTGSTSRPTAPDSPSKNSPRPTIWLRWIRIELAVIIIMGAALALARHRQGQAPTLITATDLSHQPAELKAQLIRAQTNAAAHPAVANEVAALGRLYHENGYTKEAIRCWEILQKLQPEEGRWPYYQADLCQRSADDEGLRRWLQQTVAVAPRYAPAWLELAELEFKSGQIDNAERAYRQRLDLVPRDPYARLGLARLSLQRGKRVESKEQIQEIIRDTPDFPSARNFFAELLAQENDQQGAANQRWLGTVAGRFRGAPDPWKEELRDACYDPDQLIVWGEIDLQTRQGDHGKAFLERAVRVAPDSARACEKMGMFFLDSGDPAKACEMLERAWKYAEASELVCLHLSDAYRATGEPGKALSAIDRGLALMPDSSSLHNARGGALSALGQLPEAMEEYRLAMQKSPSAPEPVANLGLTLLQMGRKEEGTAYLSHCLELQPRFPKALIALARLDLEAGRLESAAGNVFPYFQQFPGLRSARDLMAQLYLARALDGTHGNDSGTVERICREGLAIVPESAELHGFLGALYLRENRLADAVQELETSFKLRPADSRASLALANAYMQLGRRDDARSILERGAQQARQAGETAAAYKFEQLLQDIPR